MEVDGHTAIITINRPERMNAMDAQAYDELSKVWMRVRDDHNIRSAIITGAGDRAFTTGADLKSYFGQEEDLSGFWETQNEQLLNRGLEVWKPIIAAINGYCLGGGMTLMFATDIRIATPDAQFGLSEVQRGVIAGNGGTQRVLDQLPHAIAMEMLLTGSRIDAAAAERWGLVNRVVAREDLMDTALEIAHQIGRNAPLAVQASKELALRSREMDRATGLRFEQLTGRLLQTTSDSIEGPAAFAERREPNFEGK